MNLRRFQTWLIAAAALLLAHPAFAGTCLGTTQSKLAPAVNGAIFVMLGVLLFVLPAFGFFMFYIARRAKMPLPPHAEFTHTDEEPS